MAKLAQILIAKYRRLTMHRAALRALAFGSSVFALYACGGGGGGGPSVPLPTVSITASATNVAANGSVTLAWKSTNATSCTASGAWNGPEAISGSQGENVADTSSYTLTCAGDG